MNRLSDEEIMAYDRRVMARRAAAAVTMAAANQSFLACYVYMSHSRDIDTCYTWGERVESSGVAVNPLMQIARRAGERVFSIDSDELDAMSSIEDVVDVDDFVDGMVTDRSESQGGGLSPEEVELVRTKYLDLRAVARDAFEILIDRREFMKSLAAKLQEQESVSAAEVERQWREIYLY